MNRSGVLVLLSRMYRRLRYAPFLSQIVVTRRCNLACAYCTEFDHVSQSVDGDLLRRRIDKVAELGGFGVELTGGEPLLHPDLVAIVRHAASHRFVMLGLITNGFLLTERLIEGLNEADLGEMQVSVDGVTANETTNKALNLLRGRLEHLAQRAKFKVVLSAVVGSGASSDDVMTIVRFARDHGFRPRVLLVHGADGQLAQGAESLGAYAPVANLIGRHYRDLARYRQQLIARDEAPFRCRAGSRYLYVDEDGMVRWCAQTREVFGIPLDAYTADDLRRQYYTYKPCNVRCTIGCARSCSQPDRWFPQADESGHAGRV